MKKLYKVTQSREVLFYSDGENLNEDATNALILDQDIHGFFPVKEVITEVKSLNDVDRSCVPWGGTETVEKYFE